MFIVLNYVKIRNHLQSLQSFVMSHILNRAETVAF